MRGPDSASVPIRIDAVEVEHAERRVARRLHFGGEDARAQRVDRAAGQIVAVPRFDGDRLDELIRFAAIDGLLELFARHAGAEALEDSRARVALHDVPRLALEVRAWVGVRVRLRRMHLDR